jgi:hypothetical protein
VRCTYSVFNRIFHGKSNKLELGGQVHIAACDVGGELGSRDGNQVVLRLELDQAVQHVDEMRGLGGGG